MRRKGGCEIVCKEEGKSRKKERKKKTEVKKFGGNWRIDDGGRKGKKLRIREEE